MTVLKYHSIMNNRATAVTCQIPSLMLSNFTKPPALNSDVGRRFFLHLFAILKICLHLAVKLSNCQMKRCAEGVIWNSQNKKVRVVKHFGPVVYRVI